MKKLFQKEFFWETFRYLVCGVSTVLVNIAVYWLLSHGMDTLPVNTLAFFIAVLYAYFGNSLFVFRAGRSWKRFLEFMLMRLGTLLIDNGGMLLLLRWGWNDMLAKCAVNALIIIVNYILSKLLIFKKK